MKFENLTRRLADHWKRITATGRTDFAQIQVQAEVCCGKVTRLHDSKLGVSVLKMKDSRNRHCAPRNVPQGHMPQERRIFFSEINPENQTSWDM